MTAMQEAASLLLAAVRFPSPNARIKACRDSGLMSADAVSLLNLCSHTTDTWYTGASYQDLTAWQTMATALDNHLAERVEEEVQVDVDATTGSPLTVTHRTRSLLLVPILVAASLLAGCSLRPRIISGESTHYQANTTIQIGELPAGIVPSTLPSVLKMALAAPRKD